MSKKRTEIKPIRAERVKTLLERENITQAELATRIFQSQQNISRILNLKTPLTEETARLIISAFPEKRYRIEWLLGYDDYPTPADQFSSVINTARSEADIMTRALISLAELSGFSIEPTERADNSVESYLQAIKKSVTFSRDGRSVSLSLAELNDFENEICDYVEMRLKRMMNSINPNVMNHSIKTD